MRKKKKNYFIYFFLQINPFKLKKKKHLRLDELYKERKYKKCKALRAGKEETYFETKQKKQYLVF